MRPSRRKTLVGLGALATASGTIFTSASFNSRVNPNSDMRVVVDEELIVEPGVLFRDGSAIDATFDPSAANVSASETLQDRDTSSLFGGNTNDGMNGLGLDDLPAAAINEATDDNLFFEMAVPLEDSGTIGSTSAGVFQVRNETADSQDVAIRFVTFGPDVGTAGDEVDESEVVETFKFIDSSGSQISTDDTTSSPQTVDNVVSVPSGTTEQIHVAYDTNTYSSALKSAANISTSNPFNEQTDTVDLVDTIDIGIEDGTDVSP